MKELLTIPFSEINIWDVKNYFRQQNTFRDKYPLVLFGKFLNKPIIEKTKITDEKTYRILGVRSYGKGAYLNRTVKGNTLKMRTYQIAPKDHLFWCKVDTKNGAFGIIDEDLQNGIASSNMTFAEIDKSKANIEYVQLLFTSPKVNQYMDGYVTGSTNRKYIKPNQLLEEVKIPLPPLEVQNQIVSKYNQKILLAESQEREADELEKKIEDYLFSKLGIKEYQKQTKSKGINLVAFDDLNIWGADRLLRGGQNHILESNIYNNKKLTQLVFINPRTDLSNLDNEDIMSFLPMKNISDDYGEVMFQDKGTKNFSKGYTKFQEDDLLWARITPCMENGKSAIVKKLFNKVGYGSTEYHVLRKKEENFSIEFLYHLLRSNAVLNDAVNYFTGSAGQQRVPKDYLENLTVPFPPINIQKEISNKLNDLKTQIKSLKEKSESNVKIAREEFEKEIFN